MPFRPGLRRGLIGLVLAAMLPVTLASVIIGRSLMDDASTLASNRLAETARAIAERERAAFIIAEHSLRMLADQPAVRDIDGSCRARLDAAIWDKGPIINFVRSDAAGAVRCSITPFTAGATFARDAWWIDAIRRPGLSLTGAMVGPITGKRILVMFLPLANGNGPSGGVSAAIALDTLEKNLAEHSRTRGGRVAIVDREGDVVLGALPFAASATLIGNRRAGSGGAVVGDGGRWRLAVAPLVERELSIVYAEPEEKALAGAIGNVYANIVLALLALLAASLAIWFGTAFLVLRWLERLGAAAARFARGDYTQMRSAFAGAPREIVALSNDLHDMAEAVKSRDEALSASATTQANLAREVQHRVKNNLQLIASLLMLQSSRLDPGPARAALDQTMARIGALGLLYRMVYDGQDRSEQGRVEFSDVVGEMCQHLGRSAGSSGKVEINCKSVRAAMSMEAAVPLSLFLVEAVTNALQHAFTDANKPSAINVDLVREGADLVVTVADNGRGYDVTRANGRVGFDLMGAFADQLGGTIERQSEAGDGTRIVLRMPFPA